VRERERKRGKEREREGKRGKEREREGKVSERDQMGNWSKKTNQIVRAQYAKEKNAAKQKQCAATIDTHIKCQRDVR